MKNDVISSIVEKSILKNIIELKETLPRIFNQTSRRVFTSADLWHIRKRVLPDSYIIRKYRGL